MIDDTTKVLSLYAHNSDYINLIAKALSSPERLAIINLLIDRPHLIIKQIAKELKIPVSTAALHVNVLCEAGLILVEEQPGSRGGAKICSIRITTLHFYLNNLNSSFNQGPTQTKVAMNVGGFSSCDIKEPCGLGNGHGILGQEDVVHMFYTSDRNTASIVWFAAGYVEYKIANTVVPGEKPTSISFTLEICSETCGYNRDWKSDITFWINKKECATWRSPGDMGERRGIAFPSDSLWPTGSTQYGFMIMLEVNNKGCFINNTKYSDYTISDLDIMSSPFVRFRIGNKPDSKYIGGVNIFGKNAGDYNQDIIMTINY